MTPESVEVVNFNSPNVNSDHSSENMEDDATKQEMPSSSQTCDGEKLILY